MSQTEKALTRKLERCQEKSDETVEELAQDINAWLYAVHQEAGAKTCKGIVLKLSDRHTSRSELKTKPDTLGKTLKLAVDKTVA